MRLRIAILLVALLGLPVGAAAQDQAAVTRAMGSYIDAREAGRIDDAYLMIAPRFKSFLPRPDFEKMLTERRQELGKLESFEVLQSTVYPGEQVKVALDYFASYESGALECGYYVWTNDPDTQPLLLRIVHSVVPPDLAKAGNWSDLMEEMGCNAISELDLANG